MSLSLSLSLLRSVVLLWCPVLFAAAAADVDQGFVFRAKSDPRFFRSVIPSLG